MELFFMVFSNFRRKKDGGENYIFHFFPLFFLLQCCRCCCCSCFSVVLIQLLFPFRLFSAPSLEVYAPYFAVPGYFIKFYQKVLQNTTQPIIMCFISGQQIYLVCLMAAPYPIPYHSKCSECPEFIPLWLVSWLPFLHVFIATRERGLTHHHRHRHHHPPSTIHKPVQPYTFTKHNFAEQTRKLERQISVPIRLHVMQFNVNNYVKCNSGKFTISHFISICITVFAAYSLSGLFLLHYFAGVYRSAQRTPCHTKKKTQKTTYIYCI